jgi:hypothetical protein
VNDEIRPDNDEPEMEASPELLDSLVPYVDGELDAAARERVEAFLQTSPEARERVRQHRRVAQEIAAMTPPVGLADADATFASVQRRLQRGRVLRFRWIAAAAAAAVLLVSFLAVRLFDETGSNPQTPGSILVENVPPADSLLDDLDVLEDLHEELGELDDELVDLLLEELALDDSSMDEFPPLDPSLLDFLLEEEILGENL